MPPLQLTHPDPFRQLVVCHLLNRARATTAAPVLERLFERWPNPEDVYAATPAELAEVLAPLGFQNQRARRLRQLARVWTYEERNDLDPDARTDVTDLPGCGRYAQDSWRVFQLGETDFEPEDAALRRHLETRNG